MKNDQKTEVDPRVEEAVANYNESPWAQYGRPLNAYAYADVPVEEALADIKRRDSVNFHREEAACGNI